MTRVPKFSHTRDFTRQDHLTKNHRNQLIGALSKINKIIMMRRYTSRALSLLIIIICQYLTVI